MVFNDKGTTKDKVSIVLKKGKAKKAESDK